MTETVLYSFVGGTDGNSPLYGSLNYHAGELYGTTALGGAYGSAYGKGTAFKITTAGTYTQIYIFGHEGWSPWSGLTSRSRSGQNLFSTTYTSGARNYGTVVRITTAGKAKLLHSFAGGNDGATPIGGLTNVDGTLYGTTSAGGASGYGTIFKITTSGAESVLYTFGGGNDGAKPYAELTSVNRTLYGTTEEGGASNTGTIFKITASGHYRHLYSFAGGADGTYPIAPLTYYDGRLYGATTSGGGANNYGTIFSVTTTGSEKVLYSFGSGSHGAHDGNAPFGKLVSVHGAFYGTTLIGGVNYDGTIFKITPSGHYRQLYSFGPISGGDGTNPLAGLTYVKGTLYGTTSSGGTGCRGSLGCGTVYSLTGFDADEQF